MTEPEIKARMICQLHGIPIETRKLGPELVISVGSDIWPRSYPGWFTLPWARYGHTDTMFHTADWEMVLHVLKTYRCHD